MKIRKKEYHELRSIIISDFIVFYLFSLIFLNFPNFYGPMLEQYQDRLKTLLDSKIVHPVADLKTMLEYVHRACDDAISE